MPMIRLVPMGPLGTELNGTLQIVSDLSTSLDLALANPATVPHATAVDIRYGQMGLVQLRIRTTDTGAILEELTGRIATAPNFFRRTAVCLDLSDLGGTPELAKLEGVVDAVRRAGMLAVGLAGGAGDLEALSAALNLPVLSAFRPSSFPAAPVLAQPAPQPVAPQPVAAPMAVAVDPEPAPAPAPEVGLASMIQVQTIRSGQRVYARHRDLVVAAGVGAGAEVIADGCIHVYGSLRGRALAGVHGQQTARVFCQEFHAELVSIAGVFRVFETIPPDLAGKPVQAWLDGEKLLFARVGA